MKRHYTIETAALRDLAAFEKVAVLKSFTRAAIALGLTTSALSQTVRRLEAALQTRLLNRTTRSVSVTVAGERLLLKLQPALAAVTEAVEDLRTSQGQLSGTLRLNSSRLARQALAPLLAEFCASYPAVEVEVVADDALTDIVAQRFDAGVRLGESLDRDMIALPIGAKQRVWFVAAPQYLRAHGVPTHPRELREHNCVVLTAPTSGAPIAWTFSRGNKSLEVVPRGTLKVNDPELALDAARLGVGVALTFEAMAGADVERRRLQRVLEPWTPSFGGCYLYYPNRKHAPAPLQAFVNLLKARNRAQAAG